MKTPDEVKKGLEQCVKAESGETGCGGCPYVLSCVKEEDPDSIIADALAYIEQLESRLAQVERERDALKHDLTACFIRPTKMCSVCKNIKTSGCNMCEHGDLFKWRGVCAENTWEE